MAKEKILDIIKSSKVIDSAYDIKLNKGQGNLSSSATRKDYVDGEIAKQVSKSGDTMTGSLITSGSLVADGVIRTKYSVETYDTSSAYGIRNNISGSSAYIQAGKVDRDVTDQKLILSGWLGTPLTMSKFSMANGVNPQVTWGSTNHDILHRGNLPNAADVGAVSKNGDTMTGNLSFSDTGEGVRFAAFNSGSGIYNGSGDGASQDATNIQIKSWQGIGISPTAGLPAGMTMGQNSVWINARSGDIETIGKTTQHMVVIKGNAPSNYFIETDSATQKTYIQVVDGDSFRLHEDSTGITEANLIFRARVDKRFEIRNPVSSTAQISDINALTRKDYVDGEIAKQVSKSGDTMTGVLKVNAEIQSVSSNSYRQVIGNYGSMWRMDSTNAYFLLTNSGDQYGNFNALRPFAVALDTGITTLSADSCIANSTQKIFHDKYAPRITQSEYLDTGSDLNNMVMYTGGLTISRFGSNAANRPPVGSSANTILGFNPTSGYKHQIAFTDGGTIYSRYTNNSASWSNWGKVYTDIYRPTPAEVGAVNKTGDTMTGNLTVPTVILSGSQNSAPNSSTRKDYVDGEIAKQVAKTGDTMTGPLTIAPSGVGVNAEVVLNSTTTTESSILFRNGSVTRWKFYQDNSVESGSNVGSDLLLRANADDGSSLGFVFDIQRETQIMSFVRNPRTNATQDTASNALTRKDYVDGQVAALLARIVALESK